jgi:serine/threonine protein kinase
LSFLGILLYEIFEWKTPFNTQMIHELRKMIKDSKIRFEKISDQHIKNLILKLLKINPIERPSCQEILFDADFKGLLRKFKIQSQQIKMSRDQYGNVYNLFDKT